MNPRFRSRRIRILSLILLCPLLLSIPFFPAAWKESFFFSPVQILNRAYLVKKEKFAGELLNRFADTYYDFGLRIEYIIRKYPYSNTETRVKDIGRELLLSNRLDFVRIYEASFRLAYSSDTVKPIFQVDLRLGGLEIRPGEWAVDGQGDLLYRTSDGLLYFQMSKEDADRIVAESKSTRRSYLPSFAYDGFLYIAFQKKGQQFDLLETNLAPTASILPGKDIGLNSFTDDESSGHEIYSAVLKSSERKTFFEGATWKRFRKGSIELFLSSPQQSRPQQLLYILGALGASFLALLGGLLGGSLYGSLKNEARFTERESRLRLKLNLADVLSKIRGENR